MNYEKDKMTNRKTLVGKKNPAIQWLIGILIFVLLAFTNKPTAEVGKANRLEDEQRKKQNLPKSYTETVEGVSFEMIGVQGGTFQMGSTDGESDEKPVHSVMLSSFSIAKYEVTQALWQAVMGNNPSFFIGDNSPVEGVSWEDIQVFLKKLNVLTDKLYRLPTEAEWEFAARGGTKSNGYKYAGSDDLNSVAWNDSNSGATDAVGQKQGNELGLYDISGNVKEWCGDWYGDYSSSATTNPQGATGGTSRVIRGGSVSGGSSYDDTADCRAAARGATTPSLRYHTLGFRLVSL